MLAALGARAAVPPVGPSARRRRVSARPHRSDPDHDARLASDLATTASTVRQALAWMIRHHAHLTGAGDPVDVAALADDDRFRLYAGPRDRGEADAAVRQMRCHLWPSAIDTCRTNTSGRLPTGHTSQGRAVGRQPA